MINEYLFYFILIVGFFITKRYYNWRNKHASSKYKVLNYIIILIVATTYISAASAFYDNFNTGDLSAWELAEGWTINEPSFDYSKYLKGTSSCFAGQTFCSGESVVTQSSQIQQNSNYFSYYVKTKVDSCTGQGGYSCIASSGFYFGNSTTGIWTTTSHTSISTPGLTTYTGATVDTWYKVVLTISGSNLRRRIYKDGVQVHDTTGTISIPTINRIKLKSYVEATTTWWASATGGSSFDNVYAGVGEPPPPPFPETTTINFYDVKTGLDINSVLASQQFYVNTYIVNFDPAKTYRVYVNETNQTIGTPIATSTQYIHKENIPINRTIELSENGVMKIQKNIEVIKPENLIFFVAEDFNKTVTTSPNITLYWKFCPPWSCWYQGDLWVWVTAQNWNETTEYWDEGGSQLFFTALPGVEGSYNLSENIISSNYTNVRLHAVMTDSKLYINLKILSEDYIIYNSTSPEIVPPPAGYTPPPPSPISTPMPIPAPPAPTSTATPSPTGTIVLPSPTDIKGIISNGSTLKGNVTVLNESMKRIGNYTDRELGNITNITSNISGQLGSYNYTESKNTLNLFIPSILSAFPPELLSLGLLTWIMTAIIVLMNRSKK